MSIYILRGSSLKNVLRIYRPQNSTLRGLHPGGLCATFMLKTSFNKYFSSYHGKVKGWNSWRSIVTGFLPLGICLITVMQWRNYRKLTTESVAKNWEVSVYRSLPLRVTSRCWGWIADKQLPEYLRPYVYGLYIRSFGVNLSEAADEDLKSYPSLADFFARPLKDDIRTINTNSCLVSPCDGTVLHFGAVNTGQVEQVKGLTYSLENFLGKNTWNKYKNSSDYRCSLLQYSDSGSSLYQCVIYLAPGDYHRFHSPTDWQTTHRRHFPGQLLSVKPAVVSRYPGVFCINERAAYVGQWGHGFFSMTAVGATNVGSIKVYFDKMLQTNKPKYKQPYAYKDKCLGSNILLRKGDPFGEFRMGSTIVLLFEAPSNFLFNVSAGQKIKMGQSLCCEIKNKHVDKVEKSNLSISSAS